MDLGLKDQRVQYAFQYALWFFMTSYDAETRL